MNRRTFLARAAAGTAAAGWLGAAGYVLFGRSGGRQLVNVSYDATRELYRQLNRMFADRHAGEVRCRASHGGSGSQARAVIDGLPADVVTLAMRPDVDAVSKKGLIGKDWLGRLPHRSAAYTSTIVFAVRGGNPLGVRDWDDLARLPAGHEVVTANPKTSGAAKLGLIACWGSVVTAGGSAADAERLVRAVYRKVKSLESSSRAATVTFSRKNKGSVQITWENEAILEQKETRGAVQVVYPSRSLLAEPHVAVVDAVVDRTGNRELAEDYVRFLYEPAAQAVIAREGYRPTTWADAEVDAAGFAKLHRFSVEEACGGWEAGQKRFFADGGLFDRIYDG